MSVFAGNLRHYGPVRVETIKHSSDDTTRTAQTVDRMRQAMAAGARDPLIRRTAAEIIRGLPQPHDDHDRLEAIFEWIQQHVRFQDDPPEDELLVEPSLMLRLPPRMRAGDCDDYTMLAGSLLGALGYDSHIVTIKADSADPTRFSHVYLEVALPDGELVAFDSSHGAEVGWAAPRHYGLERWRGHSNMLLGNLGVEATAVPWWQKGIDVGLDVGRSIGTAFAQRVAAPPGTFIQTPEGGVVSRSAGPVAALPSLHVGGGPDLTKWILVIGGGIVAIKLISGR